MRPAGKIVVWLAAAALTVGAGVRLDRAAERLDRTEQLLYLPNGKHLRLASLGQAPVLADAIYLWAIQYYSVYEREDRFRYVEHVFGDVIAELDPRYTDAYWMGALILIVEGDDLAGGLRLLDRGIAANPDRWILPYLAGWECYHGGLLERAEEYFRVAEQTPGAPAYVRRTRIGMAAVQGDLRRAYSLWEEILQDPHADAASVQIAERQLRHLRIRFDLNELQRAVGAFRDENGRLPDSLSELLERRYVSRLPLDPYGRPYAYDAASGRVSSADGRVLAEAP